MAASTLADDERVHFRCRCGRSVATVVDSAADRWRACSRCRRHRRSRVGSLTR